MTPEERRLRNQIETLAEQVRQLKDQLVPLAEVNLPRTVHLTRSEERIFAYLTTRDVATKQGIYDALYAEKPNADAATVKIVDVFMCRIREKLAHLGVVIDTVWGRGYRLRDREKYRNPPRPVAKAS